jgi:hypothetical protein
MSHVDESTLHAYLDELERGPEAGALDAAERARVEAHILECDACSAALVAARSLRTRAHAVLDMAAPVIEVPPFEHMVAAPASARRAPRRWVPLAWAASLVMAVGSGWIASELMRSGQIDAPFQAVRESDTREPAAPGGEATLQGTESGGNTATPPGTAATATAPTREDAVAPGAGSGARTGAAGRDAAATDAAPPPSVRGRQGGVAGAAQPQAGSAPRQVPAEISAERQQLAELQVESEEVASSKARAEPAGVASTSARQRSEAAQLEGRAAAAPAAPPAARSEVLFDARDTLGYAGDAPASWAPTTLTDARERLGAPLELLAGASVERVETSAMNVVRIRQRLPSGAEAEIVQWPATSETMTQRAGRDEAQNAAAEASAEGFRVVRYGTAADGRPWVLLSRAERMIALKAPPGTLPLALVAQLQRQPE